MRHAIQHAHRQQHVIWQQMLISKTIPRRGGHVKCHGLLSSTKMVPSCATLTPDEQTFVFAKNYVSGHIQRLFAP